MGLLKESDMAVFRALEEHCLRLFDSEKTRDVTAVAVSMMKREDVPIHFPFHHFIVPAALMTAAAVSRGDSRETLASYLDRIRERAETVPGGVCGNFGVCGASVGTGIFMSVMTDSTPLSGKTWRWNQEVTAAALTAIAALDGPRCCKRTTFLALKAAVPLVNDRLGLDLVFTQPVCSFYPLNKTCKKQACPFFPEVTA